MWSYLLQLIYKQPQDKHPEETRMYFPTLLENGIWCHKALVFLLSSQSSGNYMMLSFICECSIKFYSLDKTMINKHVYEQSLVFLFLGTLIQFGSLLAVNLIGIMGFSFCHAISDSIATLLSHPKWNFILYMNMFV